MKIVFDFGGVVFRWQPAQMLARVLPHVITETQTAAWWVQHFFQSYGGDWGDFDRGTVSVPDLVVRIAQRTGLSTDDVQTVVDEVPRELQALPDSVALIRRLHAAGHTLFYLSNMPAPYATHLESNNDFFSCFSQGVFSGRVQLIKPEPAIFALAAKRFEAAPKDLLFLDDHRPNVLAAQVAGWQALHFVNAAQAEADMQRAGWLRSLG
jgi:putative hydrolase of the HAD superfamily